MSIASFNRRGATTCSVSRLWTAHSHSYLRIGESSLSGTRIWCAKNPDERGSGSIGLLLRGPLRREVAKGFRELSLKHKGIHLGGAATLMRMPKTGAIAPLELGKRSIRKVYLQDDRLMYAAADAGVEGHSFLLAEGRSTGRLSARYRAANTARRHQDAR